MENSPTTQSKLLSETLKENRQLRAENADLRRKAMESRVCGRDRTVEFIVGDLGMVSTSDDDAVGVESVLVTLLAMNLVPESDDLTHMSITPAQAFHFGIALMQVAKFHGFEV
ncbi:hypothetical protein ACOTFF_21675 [Achromobacter xylosoxidans]